MLTPTSGTLADYLSAILGGNATEAKLVFPVQNITIDGNDIAADGGIVLNSILNSDTDLQMGKAVMTECVVHLLNSSKFASFDWTEEFELKMGVSISGTMNWVTVGYFTGSKPEKIKRQDIIEFTAYDRMGKFDTLADGFISSLTFPLTMAQIYSALCSYIGITAASGDEIADVMAFSFSENPFMSGMTCRGILGAIAEANCCYARIAANGKVKLKWFSDQTSVYSVTGDDYFSVNVDEDAAPAIDYVRVGCTYDDEVTGFVYPVGVSGEAYQILDNPFLLNISSADLTTACTAIYNRLSAFGSYYPMSIDIVGNWMVETGDIIEVDIDGDAYSLPIFVRSLRWNGGCDDSYECTGRATRSEVSEDAKQQYETGGKLANKYTIRSGVDITNEGVTISGGKFLKLISGGIFDLKSANLDVVSDFGYIAVKKTISNHPYNIYIGNHTYMGDSISGLIRIDANNIINPRGIVIETYDDGFTENDETRLSGLYIGTFQKNIYGNINKYFGIQGYSQVDDKNTHQSISSDNGSLMFTNVIAENLYAENQMYTTVTSGAITWESSAVTTANCFYEIHKWGKLVELKVCIYIKNAISSFTVLGTLASDYRPPISVDGTASTMNQSSQFIQIRTNGQIRMKYANASTGETTCYYCTFFYFTA